MENTGESWTGERKWPSYLLLKVFYFFVHSFSAPGKAHKLAAQELTITA